jgi:hypothetical protein
MNTYRRRTFNRMVCQLRAGTRPSKIVGDRDILQYAMEYVEGERYAAERRKAKEAS